MSNANLKFKRQIKKLEYKNYDWIPTIQIYESFRVVKYCNIKVLQYLLQYFFSIANGIAILFLAQYCTWYCNTFISQVLQYF